MPLRNPRVRTGRKSRKNWIYRKEQSLDTLESDADSSFEEVNLGFSEDIAAKRRHSDALIAVYAPNVWSVSRSVRQRQLIIPMEDEEIEIDVGSIIVATGYDLMDPSGAWNSSDMANIPMYLPAWNLNGSTMQQVPPDGKILMKDEYGAFTRPPESVAIVHCVGSRDKNYHEYCSRVCCMYALKYGHLIHDKLGHHVRIYDFYIDMRCFGKGYEEFYQRCQEEGILFIRGKPAEITGIATNTRGGRKACGHW